jgi:photosystem II stability/assembly factor-like uncharacterized protein
MKNHFKLLSILAGIAYSFVGPWNANGQWVSTNGPGGPILMDFAEIQTNLFTITPNGIFRSIDSGNTWMIADTGIPSNQITELRSFTVLGNTLFAVAFGGLFYSQDFGHSWAQVAEHFAGYQPDILAVFGKYLYAGGTASGVYISSDTGKSWLQANYGFPIDTVFGTDIHYAGINSFASLGLNVFVATSEFHSHSGGIHYSPIGGLSWATLGSISTAASITAMVAAGTDLFAGTLTGAYLSTDTGKSWVSVNNGLPQAAVRSFSVLGSNIFAITDSGIFHSTNNGLSWTNAKTTLSLPALTGLRVVNADLFAWCDDSAIYRSSDTGRSWSAVNISSFPANTGISSLVANGSNLFANANNSTVFLTTNNGNNWVSVNNNLPAGIGKGLLAINSSSLFVTTDSGIYASNNNGTNWSSIGSFPSITLTWAFASIGNNLFAGSNYYGIYLRKESASNWIASNTVVTDIKCIVSSGPNIFAEGLHNIIFSPDTGKTWQTILTTPTTYEQFKGLATIGTNVIAYESYPGFILSKDNGQNWITLDTSWQGANLNSIATIGNDLYQLTPYSGIFISRDTGRTWVAINEGLIDLNVQSIAESDGNLYIGTFQNGVWRRPRSQVTAIQSHPTSAHYNQPTIKVIKRHGFIQILYSGINGAAHLQFSLYTLSGKMITFSNRETQSADDHTITFSCKYLPAGIYLCRLTNKAFSWCSRITVTK